MSARPNQATITFILATALTLAPVVWGTDHSEHLFHIGGVVLDTERTHRLPDVSIQFTKKGETFASKTTEDGSYSLQLPRGNFEIRVFANGFCEYRQSYVFAASGKNTALDFTLLDCSDCPNMSAPAYEQPLTPADETPAHFPDAPALKYRKGQIDQQQPSDSFVLFGKRTDSKDSATYEGLNCPGQNKWPVLLYDGGVLKARSLTYDKQNHDIVAEGDVVSIDAGAVTHGSTAKVELLAQPIKVNVSN